MNILGIIVLLCLPMIGSGAVFIVGVIVCAYTAYHGLRMQVVYTLFAVLLGTEIFYGFDVGVLSLAYLVAVLIMATLRRFIALAPWMAQRGWCLTDMLLTTLIAYALWWMIRISGILIGYFLYGHEQVYRRLMLLSHTADVWWALGSIIFVLIIIRRAHEPFRRPILFGT